MSIELDPKNSVLIDVDGKRAYAVADISGGNAGNNASSMTAFGEMSVAQNTAQLGWGPFVTFNPQKIIQITNGTGTCTIIDNFGVVDTGVASDGQAKIRTVAAYSYTPWIGAIARFTAVFTEPQANSVQLIGLGDDNDGWFFGFDGLSFGICRRVSGVNNWTYQIDWSEDTKQAFDYENGNVFQINIQWLGYGMQYFSMEAYDGSGLVANVHKIDYVNNHPKTSVRFPSLPLMMEVKNDGNITPISIRSPSGYVASQGEAFPIVYTAVEGYKYPLTDQSVGENYAFSIKNPITYLALDNKSYLQPLLLSVVTDDNTPVSFDLYLNMTLTGASFVDIDSANTPAQADSSATAWSGGTFLTTISISRDGQQLLDLERIIDKLWPGGVLTVIIDSTNASKAGAGFTFRSRV